jgi:hypothetical protein
MADLCCYDFAFEPAQGLQSKALEVAVVEPFSLRRSCKVVIDEKNATYAPPTWPMRKRGGARRSLLSLARCQAVKL